MRLKDKVAVVSGGGRGIGRAISLRLAEEGATVAVMEIDPDTGQDTARILTEKGGEAMALQVDVTDQQQVIDAIAKINDRFGRIDILVNNVGWATRNRFINSTREMWDKLIDINLKGAIYCTHAILEGMIDLQKGKIIFISSDAGRAGDSGGAIYSACKGAIIAFAKSIARETARHQINVNVVCPGPTETPLLLETAGDHESGKKAAEALIKATPLRRIGQPEDIAAAVAYLASPDSDFVTGQTLSVSGGLTMI